MRSYVYIYKDIIDPYFLAWFQFCVWRTTSWTFPVREVCLAAPSAWASQWRWQRSWCFSSCTKQPKVLRKGRQHGGFCIFAIHQLPNIGQKKQKGQKVEILVSYLKFYGVTVRDVGIGKSSWLQGGLETLRCAYHFLAAEWREGRLDVEALRRNGVWMLNRHLAQQRFGGGDHHMDKTPLAFIHLIRFYGGPRAQATQNLWQGTSYAKTHGTRVHQHLRWRQPRLGTGNIWVVFGIGITWKISLDPFRGCQIAGFQPELGRCSTTDFFVAWHEARYGCSESIVNRLLKGEASKWTAIPFEIPLGPYICIIFGQQEVCKGVPGTGLKVFLSVWFFLFVCKLAVIPGFRWPKDGLNGIFASFGIEPPPPPATTGDPAAGATASSYTGNQKGSSQTTSSQNQRHWGWRLQNLIEDFSQIFFLCWSWLQHFVQTW